jgi:zinc protease
MLLAYVQVRKGDSLEEARRALLATLDELADTPPSAEEVERAKTEYLKNIEDAFSDPQGMAIRLTNWAAMGDWRLFFLHRDRLEQVAPEDVHRVARAYLAPSNRTVGTFIPVAETPLRAEIPAPPNVERLVANYEGREAVAAGEAFDPTPANIEARTRRYVFDNGFQLALMPKENRGDVVSARLGLHFGTEESLMGSAVPGDLVVGMLKRGTKTHSRQEIEDELNQLKADVNFFGDATGLTAIIETRRHNLAEVLQLTAEMLRRPAFDPQEFTTLKEERLASLESSLSEPRPRVARAMSRHMDPWPAEHPAYTPTLEEEIEGVRATTLRDVRAFWERFYGAEGGTMAVVGDHDVEATRALAEELFGSWTSQEPFVRFQRPYREVEAVEIDIETPDKENAWMYAVQNLPLGDEHPDYPALVLANYMLGGGFLNSRLATRIRQEEGLSYGVGSSLSAHPLDDRGRFLTYAIFAPENANEVVSAFRDVLETVVAEGFDAEEFDAARRGYLDSRQNRRARDAVVAFNLDSGLFYDRTMDFAAELEAAIRSLTVDEVNAAVRRHLNPSKVSIFRAADFSSGVGAHEP